jgi:hypothetical protein
MHPRIALPILLVAASGSGACSLPAAEDRTSPLSTVRNTASLRDSLEVRVQAAAVDTFIVGNRSGIRFLADSTSAIGGGSPPEDTSPSAWADFRAHNATRRPQRPLLTREPHHVGHSDIRRGLRARVTDTTIITLSSVGFSTDWTEAVVHIDGHCGTLCGWSALYTFRLNRGRWTVRAVAYGPVR